MGKAVYGLFMILAGSGVGLAVLQIWMHVKLYRLADGIEHIDAILTKTGIAITQAILIIRLLQLGSVDPTPWGWAYLVGLLVMALGLIRQVQRLIERQAKAEVLNDLLSERARKTIEKDEA